VKFLAEEDRLHRGAAPIYRYAVGNFEKEIPIAIEAVLRSSRIH